MKIKTFVGGYDDNISYLVWCESTGIAGVIDASQFVASIFVKPARSINFISLTFVASRSGVDFEEIYGAAGIAESAQ